MPEGVVVDPVLRQRFSFERSTEADGGEVLRVEIWVEAGGGVTPHVHPAMEERFHVVSGRPSFLSGRAWLAAAPGEDVGGAGTGVGPSRLSRSADGPRVGRLGSACSKPRGPSPTSR